VRVSLHTNPVEIAHVRFSIQSDISEHRKWENNEGKIGEDVKSGHGEEIGQPSGAFVTWSRLSVHEIGDKAFEAQAAVAYTLTIW
jgi:hypothetical protein